MTATQRLLRDPRPEVGFVDEASQDAGAAFGRFVEQQHLAVVVRRQRFGGEFVLLELEDHLECRLERCLQRRHLLGVERRRRFDQQRVAGVLHVGDDPLAALRHRILGIEIGVGVLGALPVATLDVEQEAVLLLHLAASPAEVDPPDRGRVAVGELQAGFAIDDHLGFVDRQAAGALGEVHARDDLVALALAFLFVGGDPVAAHGRHVLEPEQVAHRRWQLGTTATAHVGAGKGRDRVEVAAVLAALHLGGDHAAGRVVDVADREDHLVDPVAGALVVDQALRAELADRQEAGALHELGVASGGIAGRG